MPKHEVYHGAGEQVSDDLKELLGHFFKEDDFKRLERFGGRILISLTAPFDSRKDKQKGDIVIGEQLISKLHEIRDNPSELKAQLSGLSIKQLRDLGKMIGHPLRTKSPRQELLGELVSYFHGEEVWKRISNLR